ncbi:MAG: HNH endonuclease [Planctomycetota bacterium]
MSKKYKDRTCVYCANCPSSTADHVVAREFFPPSLRNGLPKVPACQVCQTKKSELEGYLTAVLPFGSNHEAAKELLTTKVARRLDRNLKLRRQLRDGQENVWVQEKSGLVLPSMSLPFDGEKFVDLCEYIVRGLVWHEWAVVVPHDYAVGVLTVSDQGLAIFSKHCLSQSAHLRKSVSLANGAFEYTCNCNNEDAALSAWHIRFYGILNMGGPDGKGGLMRVQACAMTGLKAEIEKIMDGFSQLEKRQKTCGQGIWTP